MGSILPISAESCEGWYQAMISAQSDMTALSQADNEKFNHAFESLAAASYERARIELTELSNKGCAVSPYFLGLMHLKGAGVLQDYCLAHMWLNISASRGYKKAIARLDELTLLLSLDELSEAQKLARDWVLKQREPTGPEE